MCVGADTLRFEATFSTVVHLIVIGRAINTQTLNEELIDADDFLRIIINSCKVELFGSIILNHLLLQFFDKSRLGELPHSFVVLR